MAEPGLSTVPINEDDWKTYQNQTDAQAKVQQVNDLFEQHDALSSVGSLFNEHEQQMQTQRIANEAKAAAGAAAARTYDDATAKVKDVGALFGDTGAADPQGYRALARQHAQAAGIDPDIFERQIEQESGFNPNAVSPAGARGIAQFMPATAQGAGIDPDDPQQAIPAAAKLMRQHLDRYGGDYAKALAAYNAGPGTVDQHGGVPPFEETQRYVARILGSQPSGNDATGDAAAGARSGRVEAPNQFGLGLPDAEAYSLCGPVAALAFAQANGRNPTVAEAKQLAQSVGWTPAGGMDGVANEAALLERMGVKARLDIAPDFGQIAADASSGNPVIVSTARHYYYVNDYDPQTGKLHVGQTGLARKGGSEWMSAQEIANLDGGINGALFVDSPNSPTPSVAAEQGWGGSNLDADQSDLPAEVGEGGTPLQTAHPARPVDVLSQPLDTSSVGGFLGSLAKVFLPMLNGLGDESPPRTAFSSLAGPDASTPETPEAAARDQAFGRALGAPADAIRGLVHSANEDFDQQRAAVGGVMQDVRAGRTPTDEQINRGLDIGTDLAMTFGPGAIETGGARVGVPLAREVETAGAGGHIAPEYALQAGTTAAGGAAGYASQDPQRPGESDADYAVRVAQATAMGAGAGFLGGGLATGTGRAALRDLGARAREAGLVPGLSIVPTPAEDPFIVRLGRNDKATAGDIRTELTGLRDAQVVRGNQLADDIRQLAPDEQKALYWAHEAGNDPDTLRAWSANPDPKLDPYRADIQQALNLSPEAQRALALGEQYYTEMGQAGLDTGSIRSVLEGYQNRIYKPEPPRDFVQNELGSGVKQSTRHALQRVYDTAYDAVLGGKQFATTNYADALAIHNQEMARVNANRQMAGAMEDAGLGQWVRPGNVPDGWKQVGTLERNIPIKDADGNPVVGADGNQIVSRSVFAAPEGIAKGLGAVADPGFLSRVDMLRSLNRAQGVVKTVDLSLSAFHHFTMGMQTIYQTLNSPSSLVDIAKNLPSLTAKLTGGPFKEFEQDFVRSGGVTAKVHDNLDVLRALRDPGNDASIFNKIAEAPGIKQFAKVTDTSTEFLFGKVQRYLKVMDYQNKVAGWVASHPDATDDALVAAKRGYAREINAAYGGLNWEQMGVGKDAQLAMRLAMLAPDWTISNLALGKYAVSGGTEGASARAHIAGALAAGTLLTQGVNYLLTGHSSFENPPGHAMEVEVGPHAYTSFYRGGIGDLLKLGSMMMESGPLEGVARFTQGKASPFMRTGVGLLANADYNGRPITEKNAGPIQNTLNAGKFVAKSLLPVPLGISNVIGYANSRDPNPLGALLVGTGIARYSQSKEPDDKPLPAYMGPTRAPSPPGPPKPPAPPSSKSRR